MSGKRLIELHQPAKRACFGNVSFHRRQTAMNVHEARFVRSSLTVLSLASLAALGSCGGSVCVGFDGCSGGTVAQSFSLGGTAATGKALASATVTANCAQGAASTLSDGGGHYSLTFNGAAPCVMTVTSGGTTLHSVSYASGTFNITPETDLMLVYLAAQLGTNEANLIGSFATNLQFQQALANANTVSAAQSAVVTNLQQRYAVTLSVPAFLTTSFVVGQPGVDSDLAALAQAGAIDSNGMPDPVAVSLMTTAGSAQPLTSK